MQGTKQERTNRKKKIAAIFLLILAALLILGFLIFSLTYYHAEGAPEYPAQGKVSIIESGDYTFYDGPGDSRALIFYPGARVDSKAYEDLLYQTAEQGTDCFLVDMPLHLAIFGKNRAEDILESYDYDIWIMGGHSLGGVMASSFAADQTDRVRGLVFLASYTTKDFSGSPDIRALSVYGSRDQVLKMDAYEEAKGNLPKDSLVEKVIQGGKHAGFAWYGPQKGDGEAEISKEEQIRQTAGFIAEFANGLAGS